MEETIKNYIKNNQFTELAKYFFYETHLLINNKGYRLLEIEFYVYNTNHPDVFTHQHSQQKKMLEWYFHRTSEKENSYKGGTFKGLDITCGFDDGFGGILIRSIMNETDNSVIEGPCKVVNKILEECTCTAIINLVNDKMNKNLSCSNNKILKLELKHNNNDELHQAPRIGLTLKGNHITEKQKYIDLNYRFILFANKVKKQKKKFIKI